MTMPDALTETVAELSRLEVTLRVDHGELKYGARKGVVDAKLRRAIVGIKDVLTLAARLQQGEHPNGWRWNTRNGSMATLAAQMTSNSAKPWPHEIPWKGPYAHGDLMSASFWARAVHPMPR